MDIWAWVYEAQDELRRDGHDRLADIVDRLPGLVVEGSHEQAEALVPEGLALARAIDYSWLEVFLRHWLAQSRILHRRDVTTGMDEVVRLLDFAHGERTSNCPQSICVTQDFCSAYGVLDGPGFGEERLAASREALARIDASWPCFGCISEEHADALLDLGRNDECERFCRQQLVDAASANSSIKKLNLSYADAIVRQGRVAEAIALLDALDMREEQLTYRNTHALLRSHAYALAGRIDAALATQLSAQELEPCDYVNWLRAEEALCEARPERNDARLGRTLREFANTLRANGSLYSQGEIEIGAARLALARGRPHSAALNLDEIAALLPRLRRASELGRDHAVLVARVPPIAAATLDAAATLAQLGDDAESNHELLLAAHAADPAAEALTLALCRTWQQLGFPQHARRELERFVHAHPLSHAAFDELMRVLVRSNSEDQLRALAESVPDGLRASAQFYLGRLLTHRGDFSGAAQAFERTRALEEAPVRSTRSNLAYVYRRLDRNRDALALLDELAQSTDDLSDDWERMIVATLLGSHDKVRDSARRLGFKFEGEGPIDEPFEYCEVKLCDDVGREVAHRAVRINPVVARITAMQAPHLPCLYRDEWLIEPFALNPRSEVSAEGQEDNYVPVFRAIKRMKAAGYRIYDLDGVHPGEAALEGLIAAMSDLGVTFSQRSSDEYQLPARQSESTVRGLYVFIAVSADVRTEALYDALLPVVGGEEPMLTCRGMLRELGNEAELARHEQIAQELKL